MNAQTQHGRAVDSLVAALRTHFAPRGTWAVLSGARWKPLADFPNCRFTFDAMIVRADEAFELDAARSCFEPSLQPITIFDVIQRGDYEAEFYDKPDILRQTGVCEYCLWDPTAEFLRPPLQAFRVFESVLRRVPTCSRGVFFSAAGFRMDVRGASLEFALCGDPRTEEELFICQRLLDESRQQATREQAAIDGLTAKVDRLRAQLGGKHS